jgi:hypothetical protein
MIDVSITAAELQAVKAEEKARAKAIAEFVHEHKGRFYVAQHLPQNAQFIAPMTKRAQRLTGCSQVSARTIAGIASDPNVYSYKSRSSALARARIEYGDEVAFNR